MVADSLKSGTTIDNRSAPVMLRDTSNAPSDNVREVVPDESDALAEEEGARLHAAQQIELVLARVEQAGRSQHQGVIDVSGVHHQLRDTWTDPSQHRMKRRLIDDACVYAADEMRCPQPE